MNYLNIFHLKNTSFLLREQNTFKVKLNEIKKTVINLNTLPISQYRASIFYFQYFRTREKLYSKIIR